MLPFGDILVKALCLLFLALPLERMSLGSVPGLIQDLSIPQTIGLVLGILIVIHTSTRGGEQRWQIKRWTLVLGSLLCFFFFCEILSSVINGGDSSPINVLRTRLAALLCVGSTIYCLSVARRSWLSVDIRFYYIVGATALAFSLIAGATGILSAGIEIQLDHRYYLTQLFYFRSSGFLRNYGDIAISLGMGMAFALSLWSERRHRILCCLYLVLVLPAIAASESRNAFAVFLAVVLTLFALRVLHKQGTARRWLITVLVVAIAAIATYNARDAISSAIEAQLTLRGREDSRIEQYVKALDAFFSSPVLGVGPGNLKVVTDNSLGGNETQVHNAMLQSLVNAGIGGMAFILCLVILTYRLGFGALRGEIPSHIAAAFACYMVAIQFYPALSSGSPIVWAPFGLFIWYAAHQPLRPTSFFDVALPQHTFDTTGIHMLRPR